MAEYQGPFCNIELVNKKRHGIQGTREQITAQLRDAQGGFAEFVDVYGHALTVNPQHVVEVEETGTYGAD